LLQCRRKSKRRDTVLPYFRPLSPDNCRLAIAGDYFMAGRCSVIHAQRGDHFMTSYSAGDLTRTFHSIAICIAASLALPAVAARAQESMTQSMTLSARLAHSVMKSGDKEPNYLRIGLNGCKPEPNANRTPVNVAFVIDRSGSMTGERIAQARNAAIMAVNRLSENDIAALVIFDDRTEVVLPAQKVTDRDAFIDRIRQIGTRGSTALYDGVTSGAGEVRKFKDARHLNRVVLLSDGIANVGPSQPADFGALGRRLLAEGISVSTVGLGADYNEDLMLQLARASDGNHAFAKSPADLIQIFNREFDDVLASCAQMVSIDVELKPGVRVVRALSRDGSIEGERARFQLNQVYAATEHYVLLEIESDGKLPNDDQDWGRVHVAYTMAKTGEPKTLDAPIRGRFSQTDADVAASVDRTVMESVLEQTTRERAQQAVALRDQGRVEEAKKLFQANTAAISAYLAASPEKSADLLALQNEYGGLSKLAPVAAPQLWNEQRKALRQLDARSPAAAAAPRY
jgi:Ca-activated chloride channel homolog